MAAIQQSPFTKKPYTKDELLEAAKLLSKTHHTYSVKDGQFVKIQMDETALKVDDLKKIFFVDPRIYKEQLEKNLPYGEGPLTSMMPFHNGIILIEKGLLSLEGFPLPELAGYIKKNIEQLPFVARIDCAVTGLYTKSRM